MRRAILLTLTACVFVAVAVLFCACGKNNKKNEDCSHIYYEAEIKVAATCETEGVTLLKCEVCGDEKEQITESKGHSFGSYVTVEEQTCEKGGLRKRTCTACGHEEEEYTEQLSHYYDYETVEPATCRRAGLERGICVYCKKTTEKVLPIKPHDYGDGVITLKATCTTAGVRTYTCATCTDSYTQTIQPSGHLPVYTVLTPATCTESGERLENCSVCGEELERSAIPAVGHKPEYSGKVVTAATCTEEGLSVFRCLSCGTQLAENVLPALGHSPQPIGELKNATCKETGMSEGSQCSRCKTVFEERTVIPLTDHSYKDGLCKWCREEQIFTITFMIGENVVGEEHFTVSTSSVKEPRITARLGYDRSEWEEYTLGLEDITVNAVYYPNEYTLTLDYGDGTAGDSPSSVKVLYGAEYRLPVPEPAAGWLFTGWNSGLRQYADSNGVSKGKYEGLSDITLSARYERQKCYVAFNTADAPTITTQEYYYGEEFVPPENPVKTNYVFDYWFNEEGEKFASGSIITQSIILSPKWKPLKNISTAEQLINIANAPDGDYVLANDIDLRGEVWTPIETFTGSLNGKGHKIKNFILNSTSSVQYFGFINVNDGTVENLILEDFTFNVSSECPAETHISPLVAKNNGVIKGCGVTAGIIQFNVNVLNKEATFRYGSVAGTNKGTVENCYSLVDVTGEVYGKINGRIGNRSYEVALGGLVGENNAGTVKDCYYKGSLSLKSTAEGYSTQYGVSWEFYHQNNYSYLGGLVGIQNNKAQCLNSYTEVTATSSAIIYLGGYNRDRQIGFVYGRVGGLVGGNLTNSLINSCYSTGNIGGGSFDAYYAGGLVGYNLSGATIKTCYSTVDINATKAGSVGGFVGRNESVIQNSYASGQVQSAVGTNIGGFVGEISSSGSISKCYSTGGVNTAGGNAGRFAGVCSGTVFKCYFLERSVLKAGNDEIIRDVEHGTIRSEKYSVLYSEEFLIDEMYWDGEGWFIFADNSPILNWEIKTSHNFRTAVVAPACEYGGYTVYVCNDCGRVLIKDFVEPVGHKWKDIESVPATCTVDGYTLQRCANEGCGEERHVDIVPASGHPAEKISVTDDTRSATCTESGYIDYHCAECDRDYRVNSEALGHSGEYLRTETQATCQSEGEDIYTCKVCGEEYGVVTKMTEHAVVFVDYQAPDCVNDGHYSGMQCSVCNQFIDGGEPIYKHKLELVETVKPATCTQNGTGKYVCSVCGFEEDNEELTVIPATGHTDKNFDNICDVCGGLTFTTVTEDQFIHISDESGLRAIANAPGRYYWLDSDIAVSASWTPLGTQALPFYGILYGNNHTISGLYINANNSSADVVGGLFAYSRGTIANLNVESFSVYSRNSNAVFGAIVAYNSGNIINCAITGNNRVTFEVSETVQGVKKNVTRENSLLVGGIAAVNYASGNILNCTVSGKLTASFNSSCTIVDEEKTFIDWLFTGNGLINAFSKNESYVTTTQNVVLGGIAGDNYGAVNGCTVSAEQNVSLNPDANLSLKFGTARAYINMEAGALAGRNLGDIISCSSKNMDYILVNRNGISTEEDPLTGKCHTIENRVYNSASSGEGVYGLIGKTQGGTINGITVLD